MFRSENTIMTSDIRGDTMDQKSNKEQKKKKKWGKCWSFSPKVSVSPAAPAADAQPSISSSTRKRKRPSLRRVFRRILSALLPCTSSVEVEDSIVIQTPALKHTDDVSGSSDPEPHQRAETHEREAFREEDEEQYFSCSFDESFASSDCSGSDCCSTSAVPGTDDSKDVPEDSSSSSDSEETSSSDEGSSSGLLNSVLKMDIFKDVTGDYGAVGLQSADEKIDLLAELQAAAILEDAAFDDMIVDLDLECVLGMMDSMTELFSSEPPSICSEAKDDLKTVSSSSTAGLKQLGFPNLGNTCYMNSVLQCLFTAKPFRDDVLSQQQHWNEDTKMLSALTDLCTARQTGNDEKLKTALLFKVKKCIETHHSDFLENHQQDAHEFLMVFLSYLKDEGELLRKEWPEYTCPVATMEFQLNRLRACDNCGCQGSFKEDCNYLSLVFKPEGRLVDSLEQCFKKSSLDCSCSRCPGTTASETLELISRPRILVLQVMRFVTSSMEKSDDRLEVPEEFSLSFNAESKEMTVIERARPTHKHRQKKNMVEPEKVAVPDSSSAHYTLVGAVSHLGKTLHCGHYISHIRDGGGSGWLKCSDTKIKTTSWSKVSRKIGKNGYLLFYVNSQTGAG